MGCLTEATVLGFLEGLLSPERAAEVAAHVASCPSCRLLLLDRRSSGRGALDQTAPVGGGAGLALSPTMASGAPVGGVGLALSPTMASGAPVGGVGLALSPTMASGAGVASTAAAGLARGAAIGRYQILDVLGQGGMGVVYAAFDPELDRKVAVKVLRSESGGADAATRLLREGRAIARLAHPNVVAVFDVGTHEGSVFVAMELVDGKGLDGWLETSRPWREVVGVFLQAGAGLIAAHAAGMVHRDFKPANVLMGKDGRARVTDFGLARLEDIERSSKPAVPRTTDDDEASRLTQTGAIMGTPAYMAPEQFEAAAVDEKTDQFSFAVALYEGLYGERPFAGATLTAIYGAIVENRVSPAPAATTVPAWLRQVVLRGLRAKPDERYPTLEQMLTALRAGPSAPSGSRRRAVPALVLGVLGAAAAAVIAYRMQSPSATVAPASRPTRVYLRTTPNAGADVWATRVAIGLLGEYLNARARTYEVVAASANPDLQVEVAAHRTAQGVSVQLAVGAAPGSLVPFVTKEAPGILAASSAAGVDLVAHLERGRSARAPTADEQLAMTALGTRSLEAMQRYEYGLSTRATDYVDYAMVLDPGWAHARAARLYFATIGIIVPVASPSKVPIDAARDPVGSALVKLLEDPAALADPERVDAAVPAASCRPNDRLCRLVRMSYSRPTDERLLAEAQQACGPRYDDFAACGEVASILARFGLVENRRTFVRDWLAKAPETEDAIVLDAIDRIQQGDRSAGISAAEQLATLDPGETLTERGGLYLAAGELSRASETATRLGTQPGLQDKGRYLLAVVLILRGSFGNAVAMLREVIDQAQVEGGLREQAIEALIDLQQGIGDREAAAKTIDDWLASRSPPRPLTKIVRTFQRDLLRKTRRCPSIAKLLEGVSDPALQRLVGQSLRRLAAEHACGSCADVIRDGSSGFHRGSANVVFGRCAVEQRALDLAIEVLGRESVLLVPDIAPSSSPSPFSSMVARLDLAEAYLAAGKIEDAKRTLDGLLAQWAKADRPLPQLKRAQQLRAKLDAPPR